MARHEEHEETEERFVRSEDPSLSPEANRLLTEELQQVVGREKVRVPTGTPKRSERPKSAHGPVVSNLIANRHIIIVSAVAALVVGAIVSLVTGSWWALVAAAAVHALGTVVVAAGAIQLTTQTEHVAPDVAARLEEEGVSDPDRALTDLVEDFAGAQTAAGTAQVVSPGANEQTVRPEDDPATAAVEQRTSMTPSSARGRPGGDRSAVAALPWWVTIAVTILSVVGAAIEGGAVWVAPAVVVPLGVAWIVLQRRMDSRREEQAGAEKRRSEPAGAEHPTDDAGAGVRRLTPVAVFVVVGVVAFLVVMGFVVGAL